MSTTRMGVGSGILLGLLMPLLLWVAAEPAQAQTVDECQADIAALKVQTQNTAFIGQNAVQEQAAVVTVHPKDAPGMRNCRLPIVRLYARTLLMTKRHRIVLSSS